MKSDIGALKAYMRMLLDGTAFSNWENPPDSSTRSRLVETLMEGKKFGAELDMSLIKKINNTKDEEELKRLLDDMLIKEDEFLV
jgi:hypothetical protein